MTLYSVILKCCPYLAVSREGRVVGKGRDIRGILRVTRVRHSLSDWWADPSALNAWTKWMNAKTRIKTDMNVEGGPLKFTDANLHKAPLLFMTGP